jgi:hypothetical protein
MIKRNRDSRSTLPIMGMLLIMVETSTRIFGSTEMVRNGRSTRKERTAEMLEPSTVWLRAPHRHPRAECSEHLR